MITNDITPELQQKIAALCKRQTIIDALQDEFNLYIPPNGANTRDFIATFPLTGALENFLDRDKKVEELSAWQFFYNWQRPHGSLGGKPPSQIVGDLGQKTPLWETVLENYDLKKERIQIANYQTDLAIRKLKRCL